MNIAAYCRVSTDKEDQRNSLEAQKQFFQEYTKKNGLNLVRLYADEGISGTKIKNRVQFQQLLYDAEKGLFDQVVVKDISRFARNTVDLLQSTRKLKALGIETTFLTANMNVLGNSEFVLTIFGALAQEESANTSKRIKFGKKINAEKGKVPNVVYGYDKVIGDYFNLDINKKEAQGVKLIFDYYTEHGYGAASIAQMLNAQKIPTKRNCDWTQASVRRILQNELYIGRIINGKQEIEDFLTGKRKDKDEEQWLITVREDLKLISNEQFAKAQKIAGERKLAFNNDKERYSNKHLFSTLIKCKECGYSYRRTEKHYKNTYVRWVCSGRNGKGKDFCHNAVVVDEQELIAVIDEYFHEILKNKNSVIQNVVNEFHKQYKAQDENEHYEKELQDKLAKFLRLKEKYMDMYADDIITREELNTKIGGIKEEIHRIETELKIVSYSISKTDQLENLIKTTFKNIEDMASVSELNNAELKKIMQKIEVDKEGNVDIYLRLIGELGLDRSILINDNRT